MTLAAALLRRFWFAIPIALLALALLATRATLADVKLENQRRGVFIAQVVEATRSASGEPALAERDVPAQIFAFGRSIDALAEALTACNASARAAADRDQALQRRSAEALAAAETRAAGQAAQIDRLRASAARPRTEAEACEPSEEVRGAWR